MTRPLAILTVALGILTAAQAQATQNTKGQPTEKGFALIAETEHFLFYAYTADGRKRKVDAEKNEQILQEIAARLGVSQVGRINYYRHDYPEEVAFHVGQPSLWAAGVAIPETSTIHTVQAAHAHEIVHIVAFQLGDPGRFFQEGLAVALGDKGTLWGQPVDRLARAALARTSVTNALARFEDLPPEMAYSLAGSFVKYLIGEHGLTRVCEFFRLGQAAGAARETAFAQTFGVSLVEATTKWRATVVKS